ncbi:large conductance mechanosensitive channel protein MscL [Luteolibacter pohnpeiensis]|uniref:Large-conductance mechanosensitive channel n=1 Tax=Luteolibacter pohnpeiensis TaxID=454153 RepID=A0A934SCC4_9BACT|nr:large conductance mechanosensitive channel protein MscL [Luteolibacter pohnpeiensis]MBK1883299.1 large conductance mechanosensitive channel protein MscL [Luteolibacter pohnpeiensis]
MLEEFKKFALKGNLVDMGVAFVMGAAFTKLSTAFINDFIMPIVGWVTPGKLDFSNNYFILKNSASVPKGTPLAEAQKLAPVFAYGDFISILLNFLIVAFVMFMIVKTINKAKSLHEKPAEPSASPKPSNEEVILSEIRDLLKNKN